MAQFAEATKEYGDVMTSSPGPTCARRMHRWSPAVPEETAAQYGAATFSASSASKRGPVGPSESVPERRTSSTSSSSRSSIHGALRLMRVVVVNDSTARELRHEVEPLRPALALPADGVQVRALDLSRDVADADLVVVDRAKRRHLRRGAAHEHLVREVEVGADDCLLDHRVPEVLRDLRHRVAGDAGQDAGREIRRVDHTAPNDEDVLARAVGDR